MLWLAGLMGLMAVGAVAFVDPETSAEDDDVIEPTAQRTGGDGTEANLISPINIPEDNFEPDYDPRGGDDAALLAEALRSSGHPYLTSVDLRANPCSAAGNEDPVSADALDAIGSMTRANELSAR
jgi:hypothetical protein